MSDLENIKPLAVWEDDNSSHADLVWWVRLDDRYQIEVHRVTKYKGTLYIFDHNSNDALLYIEDVGLLYDALFGPDVNDVYEWEEKILKCVDSL